VSRREEHPARVAVVQRILPEFRYELFRQLAHEDGLCLRVLHGAGRESGAARNTTRDCRSFARELPTIVLAPSTHRVLHPDLFRHLAAFDPHVVVTEPSSYFPNNLAAHLYAATHGRRLIWWEVGLANLRSRLRRAIEPCIRLMIRRSDAWLAYSGAARSYLVERYGVPSERIFVAPNTLWNDPVPDPERRARAARAAALAPDAPTVGYIGALERRKCVDELLRAAAPLAGHSPLNLLIIGDGPDAERLRERARELGLAGARFLGRLPIEEANPYLELCDVTVLPREGGLAINHALSCGTPVICGVNDGTERDLVRSGFNGLLLGEELPATLGAALAEVVLGRRRFDRARIREDYRERFSPARMIAAIRGAIACALAAPRPVRG
jgi:glycosyltransferase involved in cell wall biosynthesis